MVSGRSGWVRGWVLRAPSDELTDDFTQKLGYTFALWLAERLHTDTDKLCVAVGHDARPSGERLTRAFIDGLTAADADVYDCGLATTPAMHLAIKLENVHAHGAAMITASALDDSMNGFKLFSPDGAVTDEEMAEIFERSQHVSVPHRLVTKLNLADMYAERLKAHVHEFMSDSSPDPLKGLHVVVDASCGTGGFFAKMLEELGADTHGSFNLEPVGGRTSNPENPEALEMLSTVVLREKADIGVIFDADADRVAIVDNRGRVINRNRLIALIAAILLEDEQGLTFVTDSVTSSGLSRFITEWGGSHYRYRRGYRNVIDEARRLSAEGYNVPIAIETSGHAAMAENYFIDDGVYLATNVICEAKWRKRDSLTLSSLIDELQEPVESLAVRLPIIQDDYKKAAGYVIQAVLSESLTNPEWRLAPDNREGLRILFSLDGGTDNAWFMLRLSVHDPVMAVNAESEVPGGLKHVISQLYAVLERDNEELDLSPLRVEIDKL